MISICRACGAMKDRSRQRDRGERRRQEKKRSPNKQRADEFTESIGVPCVTVLRTWPGTEVYGADRYIIVPQRGQRPNEQREEE